MAPLRHAITLVELVAVLVVIAAVIAIGLELRGSAQPGIQAIKCSSQLRSINQAIDSFAQNNKDHFPLPSLFDLNDATVAGPAASKDTSSNVFSLLIFNQFIVTDECVCFAESNSNIQACDNYQYQFFRPRAARIPKQALWDPAFNADFSIPGKPGNLSYAHMLPSAERLNRWSAVDNGSTQAVISDRGPQTTAVSKSEPPRVSPTSNSASLTLFAHGDHKSWRGNVAYSDNHVEFQDAMCMSGSRNKNVTVLYTDVVGNKWQDNLFFDEPDDPSHTNNFLGIFTRAGATPTDVVSISD